MAFKAHHEHIRAAKFGYLKNKYLHNIPFARFVIVFAFNYKDTLYFLFVVYGLLCKCCLSKVKNEWLES